MIDQTQQTQQTQQTTDAAPTAPAATIPDAPAGSVAPAPGQIASHADMLTQSEFTRRVVALVSVAVVGLSMLGIVAVMCYRVAVDGNAPLTNDITTKLSWIVVAGMFSMIAALFGQNTVINKLIEKVVP